MALTKLDYLRIAERVEAMYMNCSTQLILNIVRHLASGKGLSTAEWQIKKLSEMQALTRESMEIIAANTGKRREAVEQAFREVFGIGLADTEKVLQAAVKAGKLMPVPSVEESAAMRDLLQAYIGQADDTLNLVNTVMLDSTLSRYRYYVNQIDTESQKKAAEILAKLGATDEAGLGTNLAYTQNVLNTQSTSVVTGAVARQKAVRDAIKDLAEKGITGFVDAGGHHWTPEAYVNMDIRTTAHNVAIEAQKQRSAEYGVQTFQISTHAGARPLCAPYQGWICSWDNSGGTVTDLYGKEYQVRGINETSYGEAAGIFGINCGHFPETFVDGFSIPRYHELTQTEQKYNDMHYAQSQQQRELEREIRQAKTEAVAYDMAGDKTAFAKAAEKVKQKQDEYKEFCFIYDRTPRYDRTQISTYTRSTSAKAVWSRTPRKPTPTTPTISQKKRLSQLGFKSVNTEGIERSQLQNITDRLAELESRFGIIKKDGYSFNVFTEKSNTEAYVRQPLYTSDASVNVNTNSFGRTVAELEQDVRDQISAGFWVDSEPDNWKYHTITHEYGHMVEASAFKKRMVGFDEYRKNRISQWEALGFKWTENQEESTMIGFVSKQIAEHEVAIKNEIITIAKEIDPKATLKRYMSEYGRSNPQEFFAEAFANAYGGKPNVFGNAMLKWLEKEGFV